jgi:hypothetical protein
VAAAVAVGLSNLTVDHPKPKTASSRLEPSREPSGAPATIIATPHAAVVKPHPAPSASGAPAGWGRYESRELGVSFLFPHPGANTELQFLTPKDTGERGYGFEWWAERTETFNPDLGRGWTYSFAAAHTTDYSVGRHAWITNIERWYWKGSSTRVVLPGGQKHVTVKPLRTVKTASGLEGLIFDPRQHPGLAESMNDRPGGRAAVINLPRGYDDKVLGVTFYFYDKTSLDDIERVLESVTVSKDGPSYR